MRESHSHDEIAEVQEEVSEGTKANKRSSLRAAESLQGVIANVTPLLRESTELLERLRQARLLHTGMTSSLDNEIRNAGVLMAADYARRYSSWIDRFLGDIISRVETIEAAAKEAEAAKRGV